MSEGAGGKLVRDRIPELIRRNGGQPRTRRLSDEEFATALTRELIEEAQEFAADATEGELADVLEVAFTPTGQRSRPGRRRDERPTATPTPIG